MFYSKDLLTTKKGGFGVIWLAATLGSRSSLKRLSRKDVNSVNVDQACHLIASPPEPFALRLASNLLFGVVRVYNQQYQFYYSDVNNAWIKLKKDIASLEAADVNMAIEEARPEAITLRDDVDFAFAIELARKATAEYTELPPAQFDFGWDGTSLNRSAITETSNMSDRSLPLFDPMVNSMSGEFLQGVNGLDRSVSLLGERDSDKSRQMDLFDIDGGEDVLTAGADAEPTIFFDDEGNLREVAAHHGTTSADRRPIFDLSEHPASNLGGLYEDQQVMDVDHLNDPSLPSMAFETPNLFDANYARQMSPPRRPKRFRHLTVLDERTELTAEELREGAAFAIALVEKELSAEVERKLTRAARQRAMLLMTRPGTAFFVQDMISMWKSDVIGSLDQRDKKRRRLAEAELDENQDPNFAIDYYGGFHTPENRRAYDGDYLSGLQQDYEGADDENLLDAIADPERFRNISESQLNQVRSAGFIWNQVMSSSRDSHSQTGSNISRDDSDILNRLSRRARQLSSASPTSGIQARDFDLQIPASQPLEYNTLASYGAGSKGGTGLGGDSSNFLEYIRVVDAEKTAPITFDDLFPTKASRSRVAVAQGFYYVLSLSTKGMLRVGQEDAYGPIAITCI